MYGKELYGFLKYAQEGNTNEYKEDCFQDISQYVRPFIANTNEFQSIHNSEGNELGLAYHNLRDTLSQVFLDTVTWGLPLWESMYGITTNLALSYEQRREIIAAKIRGQGTTTKRMITSVAEAFSGGEVDVMEDNLHSLFIVRFIGIKGIPRNMQAFIDMLEDIKPAHLAYRFEYTFTVWDKVRSFKWKDLMNKTYDEIKIMEGV